jgi:hypothetical protein
MLGEIDDGHISIDVPSELEEAYESRRVNNMALEDEELPDGLDKKVKNLIIEKHLTEVNKFNRGELKWGMVDADVAYIQTSNMVSWAHYPIADSLSNKEHWTAWWEHLNKADNYHDDVADGARYMMDSIAKTMGSAKAVIVDLRFNGGGFDDASIEILNHFATQEIDACTKKVRLGKGFTEKQRMTLIPATYTFSGTLYVLTSHETASAAEIFVLGSKEIPNSKIIGATTEGVFSDILRKKLPNGWTFGMSNMIYESMDGVSYEEIGMSPDYQLPYPTSSKEFYEYLLEDVIDGDDAIEKVIELTKMN